METQSDLEIGIGNEESVSLKPATLKIIGSNIEEVGTKKTKKVAFLCQHPAKADPIKISSIKYIVDDKVKVVGLWLNKDSKGNIQMDSALAYLLRFLNVSNIKETYGKEINSDLDGKYLCLKAY